MEFHAAKDGFLSGPALSLTTGVTLRALHTPKKILIHMPMCQSATEHLHPLCNHLYSVKLIFNHIFVLCTIMPLVPWCKLPFLFQRPTWQNQSCHFMKRHLHSVFHAVWHKSTGVRSTELQFIAPQTHYFKHILQECVDAREQIVPENQQAPKHDEVKGEI